MPAFRILLVCTGNICRSAAGQILLVAHLHDALGDSASDMISVSSAGTAGLSNSAIHPETGRALGDLGLDAGAFRARRLTATHLSAADLILTATAEHRRYIARVLPPAASRTFTVREVARHVADLPSLPGTYIGERARALVGILEANTHADWSDDRREDDIADPMGGGQAAHLRAVAEMDDALQKLVAFLVGPSAENA